MKANLAIQEGRLQKANAELALAQAQLDEKEKELNVVKAQYDAAMSKKQALIGKLVELFFLNNYGVDLQMMLKPVREE